MDKQKTLRAELEFELQEGTIHPQEVADQQGTTIAQLLVQCEARSQEIMKGAPDDLDARVRVCRTIH